MRKAGREQEAETKIAVYVTLLDRHIEELRGLYDDINTELTILFNGVKTSHGETLRKLGRIRERMLSESE